MKTTARCPKCHHNHILNVTYVADRGRDGEDQPAKLALRLDLTTRRIEGVGDLQAAVCKQCGYTELYVKSPAAIPVDGVYVSETVGPESSDA
jgi:predicted nucleic-acid-binding Zn-ribbon protein